MVQTPTQKIQLTLDFEDNVKDYLAKYYPQVQSFRVISKSLDARGSNRGRRPVFLYMIEASNDAHLPEAPARSLPNVGTGKAGRPVIVGAGPAGLFCALRLMDYGVPSIIVERGSATNQRMRAIAKYWRYGVLDPDDNVCFGEGGAGLFSDGKLITRIKSPHIASIMQRLVEFGAPPETAYLSNPHLGSNKIRTIIARLSEYLRQGGCEIHYNAKVVDFLMEKKSDASVLVKGVELADGRRFEGPAVVLAAGHSAHDIYQLLVKHGVAMRAKDFAIGVRMEHPRRLIDKIQHGDFCLSPELGAARYRLSWHDDAVNRGSYSFCMCPGGHVLSSGTDIDGLVTNGMSNFSRSSPWSNAALVVSVQAERDFKSGADQLGGMHFQRQVEKRAYDYSRAHASGREIPSQRIDDFLASSGKLRKLPVSSCPSGLVAADLHQLLPDFVSRQLHQALANFERQMPGLIGEQGLLLAPETRTSSPLTVMRDKVTLESTTHCQLYPAGEGAGHAGGITSAAVDGVKVAMAYLARVAPEVVL